MNKKLIQWWAGGSVQEPIAGLAPLAWWDNGATYMASDGSQWTDRVAGYNFTQSDPTARPTYTASAQNGLPSFTFDATNDCMTRTRLTQLENISGLTIWGVGKRFSIAQDDGGNTGRINMMHYSDNGVYGVFTGAQFGSVASANVFYYILLVYDGTLTGNANRLKIYRNGTLQTLSFTGTIPANTGSNASSVLQLQKTTGLFFAGQALEFGIVTRAITGAEVTSLNSYLASKYAL